MNSRERVLCALNKGIPDLVPYMYNLMEKEIQEKIIGRAITVPTVTGFNSWGCISAPGEAVHVEPVFSVAPETAAFLGLDAIGIQVLPPLFAESESRDGRMGITGGLLTTREAFEKAVLPDPDDERIYKKVEELIGLCGGDYALYARIRLGASPTLLSMGIEGFSYSILDEPELVHDILDMYCQWSRRVSRNLCQLKLDFLWCFDDIAFKSGPMFSRSILSEFFMPHLKEAVSGISKPWVFHSDGNLLPILDELAGLGMDGIHPLEPGTMDLDLLKSTYGGKLCLIGNIDIDKTLTRGTREDVLAEVGERIAQLGPGGGYIISDSNSIPSYCRAENITAMSEAVQRFRDIGCQTGSRTICR